MKDSFEIELKNERKDSYKSIGYWVCGVNFLFFLFYVLNYKQGNEKIVWLLLSLMIPVIFAAGLFLRNKQNSQLNKINVTYCWLILMWMGVSIWIAVVHILLLLLDISASRKLVVKVDTNGIAYPSFPKKNIQWKELDNIIMKDGLLTIDLKNNRLLQAEIDNAIFDEVQFNLFCKQQLKS